MSVGDSDLGWDVRGALGALQARIDPYIWDQGQELFQRDAVEDFAVRNDGTIQVKILDPRDSRRFFVEITKSGERVVTKCACPYNLNGLCRHQVVALEYLKRIASGETVEDDADDVSEDAEVSPAEQGSILYRMGEPGGKVSTCADGTLLRVVLLRLGNTTKPHEITLQLYSGTGWTEVRNADIDRWIGRGTAGPHPRDAAIARILIQDGELRRAVDSDTLSMLLASLTLSSAFVDRSGTEIPVSPWPWALEAQVVRGDDPEDGAPEDGGGCVDAAPRGVGVRLLCRAPDRAAVPFDEVDIVPAASPWIQTVDGTFHPLVSGAHGKYLEELQLEEFSAVVGEDLDRLLTEGVEQLECVCAGAVDIEDGLIQEVEGVTAARLVLAGDASKLSGTLELAYGSEWFEAPESPLPWSIEQDGEIRRFPPAGQSLARARRELGELGFHEETGSGENTVWVAEGSGMLPRLLQPRHAPFVQLVLPRELDSLNWVEHEPRVRLFVGAGAIGGGGSGRDGFSGASSDGEGGGAGGSRFGWFDVECRVSLGEREMLIDANALREAAAAGDSVLELGGGVVLGLHHPAVQQVAAMAKDASASTSEDDAPSAVRLPIFAAGELLAAEEDIDIEFDPKTQTAIDGFRHGDVPPARPLASEAHDILRPYQAAAVDWFDRLGAWSLGGILADEMGLGKTLMTLSHFFGHPDDPVSPEGEEGSADFAPVLVICPTTLSFNWLAEAKRFFPNVRGVNLNGRPPVERAEAIREGADLLISSYALLRRDREHFEARELRAVVLDEAQHIKNPRSQTARAAFALSAPERWALTGTPVENHLGELWSIFRFTTPGLLGTAEEFQQNFSEPIGKGDDASMLRLRRRVSPFLLRRTKEQVLSDLPPRIEQVEQVPMTAAQETLYLSFLERLRGELEASDPKKARFQILAALTRLRQICCHPDLVKDAVGEDTTPGEATKDVGAKFELLDELLTECLEEGHRVLLFSQFTSMLDLIESLLDERGHRYVRLDGSTRDREAVVRRFQEDASLSVFLISLKAGGFGLNLTEADTVILYDPWWNPAAEEQAAARVHRIGQTVPVHIHKLITMGTVEEKILALQEAKRDLAGKVVSSEEEALKSLSTDELRSLLYE